MVKKQLWNSLEIAKLCVAILTPFLLLILVLFVDQSVRNAQSIENRRTAIADFSQLVNERTARAMLLKSALIRYTNHPESSQGHSMLVERKRLYDEALFKWNASRHANLLMVRETLGDDAYTRIEELLERRLVSSALTPLNRCLTEAFDIVIGEEDLNVSELMEHAGRHLEFARDCGFQMTEELYSLSSIATGSSDGLKTRAQCEAEKALVAVCPLIPRSPALCESRAAKSEQHAEVSDPTCHLQSGIEAT